MFSIDIKNAFDGCSGADNFTVLLLRLIAKADGNNRAKFRLGFPVEVRAVEIYQNECPFEGGSGGDPDWDKIMEMATATVSEPTSIAEAMRCGVPVVFSGQDIGPALVVSCPHGKEADALLTMESMGVIRVVRPQIMSKEP